MRWRYALFESNIPSSLEDAWIELMIMVMEKRRRKKKWKNRPRNLHMCNFTFSHASCFSPLKQQQQQQLMICLLTIRPQRKKAALSDLLNLRLVCKGIKVVVDGQFLPVHLVDLMHSFLEEHFPPPAGSTEPKQVTEKELKGLEYLGQLMLQKISARQHQLRFLIHQP